MVGKEVVEGLSDFNALEEGAGEIEPLNPNSNFEDSPHLGYVYFVRAGEAIKIGYSVHPIKRMSELQIGNPDPMELLGALRGTFQDEKALHADFSHLEIREEWFRAEEELLDFIEEISGRFIDRELRPRVSPATMGAVHGLLRQRHDVGADTPLGHRYTNLAESLRHFDHAEGEQRSRIADSIARTINEIERLSAASLPHWSS